MPDRPLSDLTVIDCSTLIAGPMAATFMADFGAEVIKVEHPAVGDSIRNFGREGQALSWKWLGRNKRSVGLDLSDPDGAETFKNLVADADVVIEGFRPGTMERWGLGWETLREVNPGLVFVRTSGFGQTGRYRERPGFGTLAEAMSGFAEVTGFPDKPPTLPSLGLADAIAACYSTWAATFALYHRDVNGGEGQVVDTSLVEPLFSIMGRLTVDYSVNGTVKTRTGNRSAYSAPRNTYETKDGRWVAISGSAESVAKRILRAVGGEELAEDPRFATASKRLDHGDELDAIIADWMAERDREEILRVFEEHEAAIGPVYDTADIFDDDYFWERGALERVDDDEHPDLVMPGVVPHLSATPGRIDHAGRDLGADTMAVLTERAGLSEADVHELEARGVVRLG
ncbi:CoA transferase [Salinirubellus salinus]|uniref:CoA transferase n=1 Tax=Salinirubellus salinus TaxID=1364945 RepID=A0A9E7R2C5_9EURY|nr:CoA transferase [Salinirubellus salinus]UWM54485.1 CoA transferase [Salinirubellus salinus]